MGGRYHAWSLHCSTVYRAVADLQHQGVPIEGEAGVGYRLGQGFDMPPLMFTVDEARLLVASVRMAQLWQDPALAQASQVALGEKNLSALPAASRLAAQSMAVYAPPIGLDPLVQATLQMLRETAQARRKVNVQYRDASDRLTLRVVRPLLAPPAFSGHYPQSTRMTKPWASPRRAAILMQRELRGLRL